jgi:2-polyprenyl-3-methyl-5-hydroxy-6-metoxy-1,4-benzoquinol methylase
MELNKEHWERVYASRAPSDLSWFQTVPETSLRLIAATSIRKDNAIVDVGGGTSFLVDTLLDAGFTNLTVLDVSRSALDRAKARLGRRAAQVDWLEEDVTEFDTPKQFALWHDRATFHFLTEKTDRRKYVHNLRRALEPTGHVIIATFAIDGPLKCSGLEVVRYDAPAMSAELGSEFELAEVFDEAHVTPWGAQQLFSYFRFVRCANVRESRSSSRT